jgi:cell division control protein 45
LPLVQSRQKFGAMDLVLRQEFQSMIAKLADKYQLHDIVFASFTLQYGFRSRYCAADVVYAMLATLESTVSLILCLFVLFLYPNVTFFH